MPRTEGRADQNPVTSILGVSSGFFAGLRTGLVISLTLWALLLGLLYAAMSSEPVTLR
jgi:hypothetical protein